MLEAAANQKDLGVIVSDDLTPGTHISHITKKCNQRIGLIKRCFTNLSANKVEILYQSLIRPVLVYGSPVWSPWYKKDITGLEKVQGRCLKLSSDPISLPELITRRQEQDMCEVYKFMHGLYKTSYDNYFQKPFRTHRGHSLKLFKPQCKTNVLQNFFSQRVIDMCNSLPEEVVSAPSLDSFKKNLRSLPNGKEGWIIQVSKYPRASQKG